MEYVGKLYGRLGPDNYFETGKTSEDWDNLERERDELKAEVEDLSNALGLRNRSNPDLTIDEEKG